MHRFMNTVEVLNFDSNVLHDLVEQDQKFSSAIMLGQRTILDLASIH